MSDDKAKRTFMSFLLGLAIGFWPLRWAAWVGTFVAGFLFGEMWHIMSNIMLIKP